MVRDLLVRGMLAGIVAGLLSFGFLRVYGEPQVDLAVAFERQLDLAKEPAASSPNASLEEHDELVSREIQRGLGLLSAVIVYCTAFGGLFGLAFAFAYGRVGGRLTPQALSALLAATGFLAIYLVPSLKYPASPPSVGAAETIGIRTALYFIMMVTSIVAMIGSIALRRLLIRRLDEWNATFIVAAYYIAVVAIAGRLLPAVNEVPTQFPAVVLWNFRVASIGAQLIMWTTLGLLFGVLTRRVLTHPTGTAPSSRP
jgi:predicted cobalt transporter CbtA